MSARRLLALVAVVAVLSGLRHPPPRHASKRPSPSPPPIGIVINGVALPLQPQPLLDYGILLVPVQRTIHALGFDFQRQGSHMTTHVGAKTITLHDGSRVAIVDGNRFMLDAPVVLRNDVFYAPLRFFTEVLGAQALFDRRAHTVTILAQLVGRSGEGDFVEGDRTMRVGTVAAVDVNSDPPTVTLTFNGVVRTIGITPNAIVTMRDVAVDVDTPGELSDMRPGDEAEITVLNNGQVLSVVDEFSSRYGTIAALDATEFVLQDGHIVVPDRDTRITLNGKAAALGDLAVGDNVNVRYNAETGEVREIMSERTADRAGGQSGAASISDVQISATRPLRADEILTVTMQGSPSGAATFDVGPYVQGIAMRAIAPGTYVGTYRIPRSANFTGVPIVGHLRMNDGSVADAQAAQTLSAAATPPGIASFGPPDGATVNAEEPAIYATFASQAVGVNPSTIRISVNGMDVTSSSLRTANFVQYLPETTYSGSVRVSVSVADFAGNRTERSWSFTVRHGM